MRCDKCLQKLYADPTINLAHNLLLAAHLAVCSDCRAMRKQLTQTMRTARTLPTPASAVPSTLRSRVMENLTVSTAGATGAKPALFSRRTLLGMTAAAVVGGMLIGPQVATRYSFVGQVQAAVQRTQTWHFVGWRLREGKKVRWEIWGQRSPYFYREQIGDQILLDDGKQRVRIMPPPIRNRVSGMLFKTASTPLPQLPAQDSDRRVEFLDFGSGDLTNELKEVQRKDGVVTLQSQKKNGRFTEIALLTASRRSRLPLHYTLQRAVDAASSDNQYTPYPATSSSTWTRAELDAQYNVPLPDSVRQVNAPQGYRLVDLTVPTDGLTVPPVGQAGTATKNGVTLQCEVVERDADGNLHLRFHGWLGNQSVASSRLPLQFRVNVMGIGYQSRVKNGHPVGLATRIYHSITDENGTPYVDISLPPVGQSSVAPEMYLVPLEPPVPGKPLPKKLDIFVGTRAITTYWDEENRSQRAYRGTELVGEALQINLPLPGHTQKFDYDTVTEHGVRHVGPRPTLAAEAAAKRAQYYDIFIAQRVDTPEVRRPAIERGLFWYREAIREWEAIPGGKRIAGYYREPMERLEALREQLDKGGNESN